MLQMKNEINSFDKVLSCLEQDKFFEYFECLDNNLKELIAYYIFQFRLDVYSFHL